MCRSQAGEDVVPTFTTSNDRMLLLLSSGQSGMLRIEDAERLQVSLPACLPAPGHPGGLLLAVVVVDWLMACLGKGEGPPCSVTAGGGRRGKTFASFAGACGGRVAGGWFRSWSARGLAAWLAGYPLPMCYL